MASVPVELLYGLYLGLLTGLFPALVSWALAFVVRYLTGIQLPGFGVVVLALALAGAQGGLLALTDQEFLQSVGGSPVPVGTAILVILMMALYAHAKGDGMGQTFPKRFSLKELSERTLNADVVDLVGGRSEVTVTVSGDVGDVEGYPALPDDLRAEIRAGEWTFPADVPLAELERRLADRLVSEFDLADVSVRIDERGRATVSAAPPLSGLSKRVPPGKRAVSVPALVPTGVARGDVVELHTADRVVPGTVVSAKTGFDRPDRPSTVGIVDREAPDDGDGDGSGGGGGGGGGGSPGPAVTDGGSVEGAADADAPPVATRAPTTTGGDGRLTVAVDRADARHLLDADYPWVVVCARGEHREFELVSLLRRAGRRIRRIQIGEGPLDGATLADASVRETYDVAVLAVHAGDEWRFAPRGTTALAAGDAVFAVGTRDALDAFAEVVS